MFQINENNIIDYLVQSRFLTSAEAAQSRARELQGGVSNLTIHIQTPDGCYVLNQALEKLRVQMDWYSDVRRIHVETACMRLLGELIGTELIPKIFFEDLKKLDDDPIILEAYIRNIVRQSVEAVYQTG